MGGRGRLLFSLHFHVGLLLKEKTLPQGKGLG